MTHPHTHKFLLKAVIFDILWFSFESIAASSKVFSSVPSSFSSSTLILLHRLSSIHVITSSVTSSISLSIVVWSSIFVGCFVIFNDDRLHHFPARYVDWIHRGFIVVENRSTLFPTIVPLVEKCIFTRFSSLLIASSWLFHYLRVWSFLRSKFSKIFDFI